MSMQTISSPRLASSGTRRRPIKPVPPRIRIDMGFLPGAKCVARSLVPPEGLPQRWRGEGQDSRSALHRGAIPFREIGGGGVGALQEFEQSFVRRGGLADRVVGQNEFADVLVVIAGARPDRRLAK